MAESTVLQLGKIGNLVKMDFQSLAARDTRSGQMDVKGDLIRISRYHFNSDLAIPILSVILIIEPQILILMNITFWLKALDIKLYFLLFSQKFIAM